MNSALDAPAGITARDEWKRSGMVPIAACLGYSAVGIQVYALGPFVVPLEQAFGWSRAQIMVGLTISSTVGVLFNFLVGVLVDRIGPRRVGIAGLLLVSSAFALLGTASGTLVNWAGLWLLVACGILLSQSTVWAKAVAERFEKGRGLALAVVLSGSSVAGAILPVLATTLIEAFGWRLAFAGVGAFWLVFSLPLVLLFFRGQSEETRAPVSTPVAAVPATPDEGMTVSEGLRKRAFWQLFIAAFIFAFYTLAISPNLVPLLAEKGAGPHQAARIAGLVGIVGIVARIGTGYLIDRLPAHLLGGFIFLLPVAGCALLLAGTPSPALLVLAAVSFGVTIGAEFDITFYLASRHFGLRSYGALMGALLTAGSLGGVFAPVTSGWIHDLTGSYDAVLIVLMASLVVAALALLTLGRPPANYGKLGH